MSKSIKFRFVGLDAHAESITVAVADEGRQAAQLLGDVPNDFTALTKVLHRLGPPGSVICCYEAGPTGYGLARQLQAAGWVCQVIAPSLVPAKKGCRIKTNRRDALKLAHFLRSGDLTIVHIPDEDTEAIRDLSRARLAAKRAERAARQQLSKFLLRQGRRYPARSTWSEVHRAWIRRQVFERAAQQCVLEDYLATVDLATDRVKRLTEKLAELVAKWDRAPLVRAFQALRGIDLVTGAGIVAEICDFRRFATAPEFMGYLGAVPSEDSTGEDHHRGRITRTGNTHARRFFLESAWHYRHKPRMTKAIRERSKGVAPGVLAIAWKAQKRLHSRMHRLLSRGKSRQKAAMAVARELAGFVWAIAQEEKLLAS
jgi:transposase